MAVPLLSSLLFLVLDAHQLGPAVRSDQASAASWVVPGLVGVTFVVYVHGDVLVPVELVGVVRHRLELVLHLLVAFCLLPEGADVVQVPVQLVGPLEEPFLGFPWRHPSLLSEGCHGVFRLAFSSFLDLHVRCDLTPDLVEPVRHLLRCSYCLSHVILLFQDAAKHARHQRAQALEPHPPVA